MILRLEFLLSGGSRRCSPVATTLGRHSGVRFGFFGVANISRAPVSSSRRWRCSRSRPWTIRLDFVDWTTYTPLLPFAPLGRLDLPLLGEWPAAINPPWVHERQRHHITKVILLFHSVCAAPVQNAAVIYQDVANVVGSLPTRGPLRTTKFWIGRQHAFASYCGPTAVHQKASSIRVAGGTQLRGAIFLQQTQHRQSE